MSCCDNNLTVLPSGAEIDPFSKITLPAEVFPTSVPRGAIFPEIDRSVVYAVRSAENVSLIIMRLPLLVR